MSVLKKAVKSVGRFVKKYWKPILAAAAIVFTAGIATVGVAGFSSAAAAAGGGFGGFISAAGSTMVAGVASIGGSLGIGQGANLAAFGGTGYATLGTGAAAQSLGLAGSNAAMTAGRMASMGSTASGQAGYGVLMNSANAGAAPSWNGAAQFTGSASGAGNSVVNSAAGNRIAGGLGGGTGGGNSGGGFLNTRAAGPIIQSGVGLLSEYPRARSEEEEWERTKPRGFWGVGLNGEEDAAPPTDQAGPAWNPQSFQNPNTGNSANTQAQFQAGLMGNRALDAQRRLNPNVTNPLSPEYDPALARINRGAVYG